MPVYSVSRDKPIITYRNSTFGNNYVTQGSYDGFDSSRTTSTQKWKELYKRLGYVPPLPYSTWRNIADIETCHITIRQWMPVYNTGTTIMGVHVPLNYHEPNAHRADLPWGSLKAGVLADLYNRVGNTKVALGELSTEFPSTVEMCVNTVTRVTAAARAVKRGKFKEAAKHLGMAKPPRKLRLGKSPKVFADNWLEYRYGWLPLYSDVYGAMCLTYDKLRARQAPVIHRFAWASAKRNKTLRNLTPVDPAPAYTPVFTRRVEQTGLLRYDVWFTVTNETLNTANQLGLANPVALAWELLPLSFVVDWFVNVGDCLNSFSAFAGKQQVHCSVSTKWSCNISQVVTGVKTNLSPRGASVTHVGGSAKRDRHEFTREILPNLPALRLNVDVDLNPKRIGDALALLSQAFK